MSHRKWIWGVYALLFAVSIPWYLPADKTPALWWGLPYWVVLSLGATLAVAVFNALVIHRYWEDPDSPEDL